MRNRKLVPAALLATMAVLLLPAAAAQAAAVTNTNDSGSGSLRQAIAEAAAGETIAVPAGDYVVSSESLAIEKSLTLAGKDSGATVIRSTGPFRVLFVSSKEAPKVNVALSGMTLRDGRVFESPGFGAGIASVNANLTLRDVVITGNIADANGELPAMKGGFVAGGGLVLVSGSLTMTDSRVTGNVAQAIGGPGAKGGTAQGGGVAVIESPFTIERSTISGNVANAGGGQGPSNPEQNGGLAAAGGFGGSPELAASSIVASTISGNVAEALPGPGGTGGEVIGGGIFLRSESQPFALTNSTIAGNSARNGTAPGEPAAGGGIGFLAEKSAVVTVTSTTIAANTLESGSPISRGGNLFAAEVANSVRLRNTIVANGIGPAGSENCAVGTGTTPLASQGFNLDSLDQCGFKSAGDKVSTNPLLLPLARSGGPTETMAPGAGSPAVDQGAAFGLTADQRGVTRPIDFPSIPNSTAPGADGTDIGAVEVQPANAFTLGKLSKNRKKGTATVLVTVPSPAAGVLTLSGKGLKPGTATVGTATSVKLTVAGKSKAIKKALRKKGKRKVKFTVTYTPTGNAATTQSRTFKLVKKPKKKRR